MSDTRLAPEWNINAIDSDTLSPTSMYAIIEPILWPEWKYWLYTCVQAPEFATLFESTPYDHIDNGPMVINLSNSKKLLQESLIQMETAPCGCLITVPSEASWSSVLDTLRHAICVRNERTEILLRYHDPRTLLPLMAIMTTQERASYFPAVTQCIWFNQTWLQADMVNVPSEDVSKINSEIWTLTDKRLANMQSILEQWSRSL